MLTTERLLIGLAVLQAIFAAPTFVRELRSMFASAPSATARRRPSGWLVSLMMIVVVMSWLAAGFDVFGKHWFAASPYTTEWLTPDRLNTFKLGAGSILNASGNFAPIKIETVAEPQSGAFASKIRDMFISSGLPIQDAAPGNPVGVPKDHRLSDGITIVAPVTSLAAETVRVGFERIGIQTRRSTKGDGDYLIVEVGAAP